MAQSHFLALLGITLTILGMLTGGIIFMYKTVWNASRQWANMLNELKDTNQDLKDISTSIHEDRATAIREHDKLRKLIGSVSRSLQAHINWHMEKEK